MQCLKNLWEYPLARNSDPFAVWRKRQVTYSASTSREHLVHALGRKRILVYFAALATDDEKAIRRDRGCVVFGRDIDDFWLVVGAVFEDAYGSIKSCCYQVPSMRRVAEERWPRGVCKILLAWFLCMIAGHLRAGRPRKVAIL